MCAKSEIGSTQCMVSFTVLIVVHIILFRNTKRSLFIFETFNRNKQSPANRHLALCLRQIFYVIFWSENKILRKEKWD